MIAGSSLWYLLLVMRMKREHIIGVCVRGACVLELIVLLVQHALARHRSHVCVLCVTDTRMLYAVM